MDENEHITYIFIYIFAAESEVLIMNFFFFFFSSSSSLLDINSNMFSSYYKQLFTD